MSLHDEVEAHFRAEARRIKRMAKSNKKRIGEGGSLETTEKDAPDLWDEEQENK